MYVFIFSSPVFPFLSAVSISLQFVVMSSEAMVLPESCLLEAWRRTNWHSDGTFSTVSTIKANMYTEIATKHKFIHLICQGIAKMTKKRTKFIQNNDNNKF